MADNSAMSSYYIDECEITSVTKKDAFHETEESITVKVPCYIIWKPKALIDINGIDVVASGTVIMENRTLNYEDKITIEEKTYIILKKNVVKAFNDEHLEVDIQ